jgi:hypothetical protein
LPARRLAFCKSELFRFRSSIALSFCKPTLVYFRQASFLGAPAGGLRPLALAALFLLSDDGPVSLLSRLSPESKTSEQGKGHNQQITRSRCYRCPIAA